MRLGIPESRVSAGAWGVLHGVLEKVEQGTGAPGLDFFYVFFSSLYFVPYFFPPRAEHVIFFSTVYLRLTMGCWMVCE